MSEEMGYVIKGPADIRVATEHAESNEVVLSADGRPYPLGMVMPDGEDFCYADSMRDLICALIPEYEREQEESEKAFLRIVLADRAATIRQAEILVDCDPGSLSESEWATLTAPKTGPDSASAAWWRSAVPLLLVSTSYEPYTPRPRPASNQDGVKPDNLFWIDPTDEESLIESLHSVGYVRVLANIDFEGVMITGE
jgi:hypothetical protein